VCGCVCACVRPPAFCWWASFSELTAKLDSLGTLTLQLIKPLLFELSGAAVMLQGRAHVDVVIRFNVIAVQDTVKRRTRGWNSGGQCHFVRSPG
jgi:hypothetical protein